MGTNVGLDEGFVVGETDGIVGDGVGCFVGFLVGGAKQ